ncbi:MAG: phenylacetic acid degradation bifunctional protein PaaZ [Ahrensia sp.]|nr:phenylacetic acid degradation bifunctional protein PaaZ [Ahrensia sp.]
MVQKVESFVLGKWIGPGEGARSIAHAITGDVIAEAGNDGLDYTGMIDYAISKGGLALRSMSFHQRADMLKKLALHLNEQKEKLYEISFATGATAMDHMVDVDGGIGTLFVYASKGKKELPDTDVIIDGEREQFGKTGVFLGQHVYTSKPGVAVHINAFNFPVWGMLEKIAPSLLAGIPSIVKPATVSCYVTETCVRLMNESGVLPEGAVQLVTGGLGNTLDLLTCQDIVTFTGSAETARHLRNSGSLMLNGVPFSSEQDSLNASILGPDAVPGTPEFDLFVKEVTREMTVKSGQKCTAIRRILTPQDQVASVIEALSARLEKTSVGDPRVEGVRMGALVSQEQRKDVLAKAELISCEAEKVFGGQDGFSPIGADIEKGAFVAPTLYCCADPDNATAVHETEAFGPVSTVMGYRDLNHAIALANRGQGSLVASVITHSPDVARAVIVGSGPFHGRLYFNDRDSMSESTGHGAPMPHMVHGGPGRAGGGEELGGIRGVKHFMQRTAVQGGPAVLNTL